MRGSEMKWKAGRSNRKMHDGGGYWVEILAAPFIGPHEGVTGNAFQNHLREGGDKGGNGHSTSGFLFYPVRP